MLGNHHQVLDLMRAWISTSLFPSKIAEAGQELIVDPENLFASPLGWSDFSLGDTKSV